jgi:hypothetical protein
VIDFDDVMLRVKEILATHKTQTKIRDKDIADFLQLDAQYYAVIKRRKKLPYESLATVCYKNRISLNWLLLAQKPQYLTTQA